MLRLVLTVAVLTSALTLAAPPASQDCVDMKVRGNKSTEVKRFTSKEGELLYFPDQGFEGVTIKLVVLNDESTQRLTREELCVNSEQWYRLKVKVLPKTTYHQCTFKSNSCSGKCGWIHDYAYDDFESFIVKAHGASFWSLNNTSQKTRCTNPFTAHTITAAATTPITHSDAEALAVWIVGVGGGVLALAAVVTMAYVAARRIQSLRSVRRQHSSSRWRRRRTPSPNTSSPLGRRGSMHIINNSIYEPFCDFTDSVDGLASSSQAPNVHHDYLATVSGTQQQQQDGFTGVVSLQGRRDSIHISNNSLYEPFCAVTDSAGREVLWRREGDPTDAPCTPLSPSLLLGEALKY